MQWQTRVIVAKAGAHCADDPNCFNRYHPAIKARARAKPGDHIIFETRDALDSDLKMDSVADDVTAVDLNLVHPMTGPVHIEGAKRGGVLPGEPEVETWLARDGFVPEGLYLVSHSSSHSFKTGPFVAHDHC